MRERRPLSLRLVGPGLVLAATGVGAGDLVAAAVSGATHGMAIIWAAAVGAILKFGLSEGMARWQLATGTTLLEGWARRLGGWVQYVFLVYLVLWSFIVAGALMSACGLAAHALVPALSVTAWGMVHAIVAAAVVVLGGYEPFERLIKLFVGLMFVTLVGCAAFIASPAETLAEAVRSAAVPPGGAKLILAVIGGVGGSVTLLSYGYWIREKRWEGREWIRQVRLDLGVAYGLTGVFGIAVMVLAGRVLHGGGVDVSGNRGVLAMAGMLEQTLGPLGHWTFLVGFWGAVATSMLGVWQGVPYLFCDFVGLMRRAPDRHALVSPTSVWYRAYLAWLAVPPMALLFFDKPVGLIVAYSVLGALFMPFVAMTLLFMNGREDWVGHDLKNRAAGVLLLVLCLVLFAALGAVQLAETLGATG